MWEDPIVKEVRQHRLAIEAEAGNDWGTILARAVEAQQKFASHSTPLPTVPASLSVVDDDADSAMTLRQSLEREPAG